jgi:SpoVK/Ycf46/Vps4 family AAA+-type ATPase
MKNLKNIVLGLCLFSVLLMKPNNDQKDLSADEKVNFLISEIFKIFNKIDPDRFIDKYIVEEKLKLIEKILNAYGLNASCAENTKEDKEAHFFTPQEPIPLTGEEKKLTVQERISKKYIGDLPKQINSLIFYFSNHQKCLDNQLTIYNRLLLHGKPGTGKSHLFKVLAQELQVRSLSFSASFFSDKYIGETSRRVRKAFEAAKNVQGPVLVFIDEIDALATKRKENTHDEHRATLITLLTELQNLQDNKNVFVIAATNDINALDPAIKDRFAGSVCEIKDLSVEQRAQLFKKVFIDKNFPIEDTLALRLAQVIDTNSSIDDDKRFSNRDIEYIVTAALLDRFEDQEKNKDCKQLCAYLKQAIDSTGKEARYSYWRQKFCDGI